MAQNLFKTLFLLVLTVATLVLLGFSLLSDLWIRVDIVRLEQAKQKSENEYLVFSGETVATRGTARNKSVQGNVVSFKKTPVEIVKTTTTAKPTTTSTEHADTYDYEQDYSDDESDTHTKTKTRRDLSSRIDIVYLTKLWPLVKYKSLYSECVEYKEFHLKLSTAYLGQSKKEPLIGKLNYGSHLNSLVQAYRSDQSDCQPGTIKCLFSQGCVSGNYCDGQVDCADQSDEQMCSEKVKCSPGHFECDNRCWSAWNKCDQLPHCTDLSDEIGKECQLKSPSVYTFFSRIILARPEPQPVLATTRNDTNNIIQRQHSPYSFGQFHYDKAHNCFVSYFDFKGAKQIRKENLMYLTQPLADTIQETNNINYHVQLIYSFSFAAAFCFCLMALFSLLFVVCFKKVCFQCPFWFYGFFNILAWLASSFGLITFLYECFSNQQRTLDPLARMPIETELVRLNVELARLHNFGASFWVAVAATATSFFASFVSCIICCRLPTSRHEDKEYKIMQLPTYS